MTKKTLNQNVVRVIYLFLAFALGYLIVSLLLPSNNTSNQKETTSTVGPAAGKPTPTNFDKYIEEEFIPVAQTSYPQCSDVSNFSGLIDCIALKDKKFDFDKMYALVDDKYVEQILPMYWQKVYQYHNLLTLPAKDKYALEWKRKALEFWVKMHRIESPRWCNKIPEQALRQECLKMIGG